jgi:hypothetical protein
MSRPLLVEVKVYENGIFRLMVKQPSLISRYSMAIPVRFVTGVSSRVKKSNLLLCSPNFVPDWINAALFYPTY